MTYDEIVEKCAELADAYADGQDKTVKTSCVAKAIRTLKSSLPAETSGGMTAAQIKHLVDRFLQWRLPKDFNPDAGISYKRPNYAPNIDATPSGTNLLDAAQATDMVRFMVEGMPASSLPAETVSEAYPPESELPDWDDILGRAPDATGDLSSEAFVRELRDGWR